MGAWESLLTALGTIQRAVSDRCGECSSDRDVNPCTGLCSRCEIAAEVEARRTNFRYYG